MPPDTFYSIHERYDVVVAQATELVIQPVERFGAFRRHLLQFGQQEVENLGVFPVLDHDPEQRVANGVNGGPGYVRHQIADLFFRPLPVATRFTRSMKDMTSSSLRRPSSSSSQSSASERFDGICSNLGSKRSRISECSRFSTTILSNASRTASTADPDTYGTRSPICFSVRCRSSGTDLPLFSAIRVNPARASQTLIHGEAAHGEMPCVAAQ